MSTSPRPDLDMRTPERPDRGWIGRDVAVTTEAIQLAQGIENVGAARRFVTRWFSRAAGLDSAGDVCADLALVTSELVTNAFEHGDDEPVEVRVAFDGTRCWLSVTSSGGGRLVPSSEWRVAAAPSSTGRGLGIVKSLVDSIDVRHDGAHVTVTVARRSS